MKDWDTALGDRIKKPAIQKATTILATERTALGALPLVARELSSGFPLHSITLITGSTYHALSLGRWNGNGSEVELPPLHAIDEPTRRYLFHDPDRVFAPDTEVLPGPLDEAVLPTGCRTFLFIPAISGGKVLGGLALVAEKPGAFSVDDARQLEMVATTAGLKIAVDRLETLSADRERALKELTGVMRLSRFAVTGIDRKGKLLWWNRGGQEIFNYSRDEAIGRNITDLVTQQDRQTLAQIMLQARREFWAPEQEVTMVTKDGDEVPGIVLAHRIQGATPDEDGLALAFQDVSNWKRLDQLKDLVLAGVSHEMRTPLTNIQAYAEILRDHQPDQREDEVDFLNIISDEAGRLGSLISDILETAKLEAGGVDFSFTSMDPLQACQRAAKAMAITAQKEKINLTVESTGGEAIQADPDRIHQVLINIIANAIKFTPPDGQISLTVNCAEDDVVITVDDSGPGISAEERERVFEKFAQAGQGKAGPGGTGLGLAICRAIVKGHCGAIRAEVAPGGGTRILIELPRTGAIVGLTNPL